MSEQVEETPDFEAVSFHADQLAPMDPAAAVHHVLTYAAQVFASDLYFHTDANFVTVAMRRLGTVERIALVSLDQGRQMISHIKATAGMDISERRRPSDGRWIHEDEELHLDVRVNTIATLYGEDMTLRLWNRDAKLIALNALGIPDLELGKIKSMLGSPSGLILVTGPTGTGKTTTLYSCLDYLNDGTRKINTLEDPIEYAIDGVRQSQINQRIGLDFPELLRSVLRQSPDVIMVGEIRDPETAATAVRAANSGHLVMATLHAPVAAAAVQSMLVMGSQPYFLANCLLGVISQRLIRTLCPDCRMEFDISDSPHTFDDIASLLGPGEGRKIYGPGSCDRCLKAGYVGRTGIFEVMTMNPRLREMIATTNSVKEIEQTAIQAGMIEFRRSSLLKVAQGVTSTEEILREVPAEHLGLE